MSSNRMVKQMLRGTLLTVALLLAVPALAAADAPDITSAAGSVVSRDASGTTVEIHGTWAWTTHRSNCNENRAGAGFAIDWNDNNGNHVTVLNGVSIDVGVLNATALNAADNLVRTEAGTSGPYTCGIFSSALGYNTGSFSGFTHKFAPGAVPEICALAYDVHGKNGVPSGTKETTAGGANHNEDNSAEKNGSTPAGNVCHTVVIPSNPQIHIEKSGPASALAGSDVGFTLEVTNPGDESLSNVTVADPRCDATAPTLQSKHGDTSPNTLDPGDSWSYTCSSHTTAGSTTLHNVATTTGTPPQSPPVTDDDDVDVPLRNPAINIDKTGPATVTAGATTRTTSTSPTPVTSGSPPRRSS